MTGGSLTELSIRRPVLITVANLLIIIAGLGAMMGVDVRELPDVDRPVVSVRAQYRGASPKTMDTEVANVIEGAVARVSGVKSIFSSSEEDSARTRVEFEPGIDINVAASDVREAVSRIQGRLPDDVEELIIFKADDDAQPIAQIAAFSDTLTQEDLALRIEKEVSPQLLSIAGVAEVRLDGSQQRILSVVLDPARMASHRVSASEVIETIENARFDVPAGSYESGDQELIVRAFATVVDPERVERLHIRDNVRIENIGEVFYAPMEAESFSLLNGRPVIGMGVVRQAGSNTIAIANDVQERVKRINERARDYQLAITSDDSIFIKGALHEVILSLLIAVVIVLFVVGIFLGQWRAVLVPAVTMPVSLIGTLAAIWALGFSINLLTLLALVLATGLVVDDAIIVLENIQRRRGEGLARLAAAVLGTRQVFFAVIATTATLVAVFLPLAILPGETGMLFREFGLVLAISVAISAFVALTLCPMLTARLPEPKPRRGLRRMFETTTAAIGGFFSSIYFASLRGVLKAWPLSLAVAALIAVAGVQGFLGLNQELVPNEDRGVLNVMLTGPDGSSLPYTDRQSQKVEAVLLDYQNQGSITDIYSIVGRWDKNRAYTGATLPPWEEREFTQMELADEINRKLQGLPGAQVRINQGNSLGIGGGSGGLQVALLGNEYEEMSTVADEFAAALRERIPQVEDVTVQYNTSQPELSFNIDRERAQDLDVPMDRISSTIRVMVDKYDVLDLSIEDQAVPVLLSSTLGAIDDPDDLLNVFVTNEQNELVPLASLVQVEERGVASELDRHAQRRAIELDIAVLPGAPLGDVLEQVRQVGADILPANMSLLPLGEAATLDETSYEVALTFVIAILVVFLVLAAQFESIGSALIVMFTVPFGLAASVFALQLSGQTLNLYSQIGLVMLVGLMTKNAILLVEFMDQLRDEGMSVQDAVMEAVRVRLRPLAMTVVSTLFGCIPLMLGSGAGSEARAAIGFVIFGGLLFSTVFTLYLAPLGYLIIAPVTKRRSDAGTQLEIELREAARLEQRPELAGSTA